MKKAEDNATLNEPKQSEENLQAKESPEKCIDHMELRKDKKYINKIQQILSYHDKTIPINVLIALTFREKDCMIHIIEIWQ